MEDALRDFFVQNYGPLPVIGLSIAVAAFAFWGAYKVKDESGVLAGVGVMVGLGFLTLALAGLPAARASCRSLYQSDRISYVLHHCENIVSCSSLGTFSNCS